MGWPGLFGSGPRPTLRQQPVCGSHPVPWVTLGRGGACTEEGSQHAPTILALPPLPCLLSDRKVDIIQKGLGQLQRSFERQIKAGKLTLDDANAAVGRIDTALSLEVRG